MERSALPLRLVCVCVVWQESTRVCCCRLCVYKVQKGRAVCVWLTFPTSCWQRRPCVLIHPILSPPVALPHVAPFRSFGGPRPPHSLRSVSNRYTTGPPHCQVTPSAPTPPALHLSHPTRTPPLPPHLSRAHTQQPGRGLAADARPSTHGCRGFLWRPRPGSPAGRPRLERGRFAAAARRHPPRQRV